MREGARSGLSPRWLATLVAGVCLIATGCGSGPGDEPGASGGGSTALPVDDWDAVLEAANEEGEVVVFASQPGTESWEAAFEKAATFFGVRNNLACRVRGGRLEHDGGAIVGSEVLATQRAEGQQVRLFVRARDTRLRDSADGSVTASGTLSVRGTLAQVVLGEGGHRQAIVDVQGKQWFVDQPSDAGLRPGQAVQIVVAAKDALIYCDDKLEA
jgi:hypothetical protein